jgi:hypothetical protein
VRVCRRRMRQSFSRGLLGRTVAPVLVRRCAGRVDAKVAATLLLEETVHVHRLGVGVEGVMFSGRLAAYKCAVSFTANETFTKQPYWRGCFAGLSNLMIPSNVTWRGSNEPRHVTFEGIIKSDSPAKQPLQYGLSSDGRVPQTIAQKVCVWQVGRQVCVCRPKVKSARV